MKTRTAVALVAASALAIGGASLPAVAAPDKNIDINVALKADITPAALKALGAYGKVTGQLPQIDAVTLKARSSALPKIQALDIVAAANPDAKRIGKPVVPSENQGQQAFYYLGGTSMAAPHVAGLVALMAEKDPGLTQTETETILESTAVALDDGCAAVRPGPGAAPAEVCWGENATGHGLVNAFDALAALD